MRSIADIERAIKMPSRLIQGLDSYDTCSQFSDSATLHTLTRMGALQKEGYFSRSESNFNNFDTISYGNSSTCCCDAEIKVIDLLNMWIRVNLLLMSTASQNNNAFSFDRWIYNFETQFINAIQGAALKRRAQKLIRPHRRKVPGQPTTLPRCSINLSETAATSTIYSVIII